MHQINNQFYRWRRVFKEKNSHLGLTPSYIPEFKSLKELAEFLRCNPDVLGYGEKGTLQATTFKGAKNETFIILADPNFIEKNSTTTRLYVDATFSVRPKGLGYQLLSIMVERFGQVCNGVRNVFNLYRITFDRLIYQTFYLFPFIYLGYGHFFKKFLFCSALIFLQILKV